MQEMIETAANVLLFFRDPAAFIENGVIHLFFTLVENREDGQYFYVAKSESLDFSRWTSPVILTEGDKTKNYSSPGNVIQKDEEYILCLQSYPRPNGEKFGNDDSRIYTIKSPDLIHWTEPELLMVKGDVPVKNMGRMIDPYILEDNGEYLCFYKQNGVSFSTSKDLAHWTFLGRADCGENVCVLKKNGVYMIFHSPQNGIELMSTTDFRQYTDCGVTTLYQSDWTWAKDRITAGFVLDISELDYPYRYAMFFHGDNEDNYLFGASIGVVFGDDLHTWVI